MTSYAPRLAPDPQITSCPPGCLQVSPAPQVTSSPSKSHPPPQVGSAPAHYVASFPPCPPLHPALPTSSPAPPRDCFGGLRDGLVELVDVTGGGGLEGGGDGDVRRQQTAPASLRQHPGIGARRLQPHALRCSALCCIALHCRGSASPLGGSLCAPRWGGGRELGGGHLALHFIALQ